MASISYVCAGGFVGKVFVYVTPRYIFLIYQANKQYNEHRVSGQSCCWAIYYQFYRLCSFMEEVIYVFVGQSLSH